MAIVPGFILEIKHWRTYKSIKGKDYWTGWSRLPFYLITAYSRSWAYKLNLAFTAIATLWTVLESFMNHHPIVYAGFLKSITFGHPFIEYWILLLLQPKFKEWCKDSFANELSNVITQLKSEDIPNDVIDKFYKLFDFNVDYDSYLLTDYYENGVHVPKLHAFGIDSSIVFKPLPLGLFMEKNYHFGTNSDYEELMYNYHKGEIWTRNGTYEGYREYK
jgi:hypothetical protein